MRLSMFAPFLLALLGQAALAADAAPAAQPSVSASAVASAEPEAPKLVCHQESDIGSMRMHKVCTKVLTDAERLQTQDSLRNNLANNNLTHPAPGSGH